MWLVNLNLRISMCKQQGFTLLEVLTAVVIIAFTVPALMSLMGQQLDTAARLRDRTMANWIAENKATELRLQRQLSGRTLQRETDQIVEMSGTEWMVKVDIEPTELGALVLYRIIVEKDEEPIITLETYLESAQ